MLTGLELAPKPGNTEISLRFGFGRLPRFEYAFAAGVAYLCVVLQLPLWLGTVQVHCRGEFGLGHEVPEVKDLASLLQVGLADYHFRDFRTRLHAKVRPELVQQDI